MRSERRSLTLTVLALTSLILSTASGSDGPARPKTSPQPKAKAVSARDAVPTVISSAKKREQSGSNFLKPPGSARYEDDDSIEILPWRQASFFGLKARGQFFVFVVDCSGSMVDEDRLARAKDELRKSVARLQEPQRFQVIFYNDRPIAMPGDLPKSAGLTQKNQFLAWLRLIEPDGETDPRGAMALALSQRPDAVFLLSDGEFPDGTVEAIAKMNRKMTPIHCVDLSGGAAGDQLKRIAIESEGRYASRPYFGNGD